MDIKQLTSLHGLIVGDWQTRTVWFSDTQGAEVKRLLPDRSFKVIKYTAGSFDWGNNSPGCSQLALALMLYYLNDEKKARRAHVYLKRDILMKIPPEDFIAPEKEILMYLQKYTKEG